MQMELVNTAITNRMKFHVAYVLFIYDLCVDNKITFPLTFWVNY